MPISDYPDEVDELIVRLLEAKIGTAHNRPRRRIQENPFRKCVREANEHANVCGAFTPSDIIENPDFKEVHDLFKPSNLLDDIRKNIIEIANEAGHSTGKFSFIMKEKKYVRIDQPLMFIYHLYVSKVESAMDFIGRFNAADFTELLSSSQTIFNRYKKADIATIVSTMAADENFNDSRELAVVYAMKHLWALLVSIHAKYHANLRNGRK